MTNDHQMPLFNRYDLSVEFDRNLTRIRKNLRENWHRFAKMADANVIDEFWIEEMVCPLELLHEHASIAHVEGSLFEFTIRYRGDDELWHLYPVDVVHGMLGEVFRGKLLLQSHAGSEIEASELFQERLSEISDVIAQQNQRLAAFEAAIPMLIRAELVKLHRWPPEPFIVLCQ